MSIDLKKKGGREYKVTIKELPIEKSLIKNFFVIVTKTYPENKLQRYLVTTLVLKFTHCKTATVFKFIFTNGDSIIWSYLLLEILQNHGR